MLSQDILPYLEPTHKGVSLYLNPKDNSVDNSPLFTARTIMLLYLRGELTDAHREWFLNVANSCMIKPGLYSRHPINKDQNAWDNYIGLAVGFWIFGMYDRVREIIHYGNTHLWIWKNGEKLEWRAVFGRYPDFMPFLRACTHTGPITGFDATRIALGYRWGMDESLDETSGRMLLLDRQVVFAGRSTYTDAAIKIWRDDIDRRYVGGIQAVRKTYFKYNHPLGLGELGELS